MAAGVGAIAIAVFVWRQLVLQKDDKALLDLRTLKAPTFTISVLMMVASMMSLFGVIILLPIYTQNVLGLDTLKTGLLLLPGGLVMGLLAPPVGRLYDKFGPAPLVVPGTVLTSASLWSLTFMNEHTPVGFLFAAHLVLSVGLALTFTPLFSASLGALPSDLYSHGSALIGTVQQVSGAAGTALFIAVMAAGAAKLAASDLGVVAATAGGIREAFLWGAVISTLAIVAAFFIRKPDGGEPAPMAH